MSLNNLRYLEHRKALLVIELPKCNNARGTDMSLNNLRYLEHREALFRSVVCTSKISLQAVKKNTRN